MENGLKHEHTTTEDSDVVDFKQECKPVLVDKFFLHDTDTAESESLGSHVQEFSILYGSSFTPWVSIGRGFTHLIS